MNLTLNAERAVLASFLIGSPDAPLAFERLSAADFFDRRNAIVFATLKQLHTKRIPTNEIAILLNSVGSSLGDEYETGLFLNDLIAGAPKSRKENIEFHIQAVRRASQQRDRQHAAQRLTEILAAKNGDVDSADYFWQIEILKEKLEPREWPPLESLGSDLPPVPTFNLEMLPVSFRGLVDDVSERTQTPPDFAAAAAIVALAGCVGRRARIHPKTQDATWEVVPNLWGAIVAHPGFLKTPVSAAVTAPLGHVEEMWRAEHAGKIIFFEAEKERTALAHQAWREQYKHALKNSEPLPHEPPATALPPVRRRLLVSDATPEKLQEILAENPAGMMVLRDELVGLIAEMDKEGREAQRTFFLQGWNGYGAFTVDRIGRGTIHIPNVCLSVFGNIQPARLRDYLGDVLDGGPGDDGLFQRFQILVWPDAPSAWRLVDRPPNNSALACAEKIFSRLANLPTESIRMRFTPIAQQFFFDWWKKLEEQIRGAVDMHPALVAHLSKYRSLMPSLAALFEVADQLAEDLDPGETAEVNEAHATQAVEMCSYLEAHARRVYSCITSPQLHAARELSKHIQRGALPNVFSARDIYKRGWTGLDEDRVLGALARLVDAGWVRRLRTPQSPAGGRPTERWEVNPAVRSEQL